MTVQSTAIAVCLAGALSWLAPAPAPAQTSAPSTGPASQDVSGEIKALRARLDELEKQQAENLRQQEIQRTKDEVRDDAARQSMWFSEAGGFLGGFENNRFVIRSADGNYAFRPWLHLQLRYTSNWREDAKASGEDDIQSGFELRRARFGFDGNLFSPDFTYLFNWATYRASSTASVLDSTGKKIGTVSRNDGGLPVLEEAFFQYRLPGSAFYIKGGQMHDPLFHETIVGSKYRAPETSLIGDIFGNVDTFVQGVSVIWDPKDSLRAEVAFTDGIRSANTDFRDYPNNSNPYDWGVAGRVEWKVMGDWKDYNQITAYGNKKDLLVLGLGADWSQSGDADSFTHTFDVQYGGTSGLFFYGCLVGRMNHNGLGIPNGGAVGTSFGTPAKAGYDTYEYGASAQVAYLINKKWEPYVRYEYLHLAGTPAGSQNFIHDISLGFNYYFVGHNAKLTTQLMYLPNGLPIDDTSSDVLMNNGKNELILIVQFQLLL